jgi:ferredoxin
MGILKRITGNLFQPARTRRPDADVPFPDGFRGALLHDAGLCTACGACAYACSPSAIVVDTSSPDLALWQYQLLQCTFCGRCAEMCPTGALSFEPQPAQSRAALLASRHSVPRTPCARCGAPHTPLPRRLLEKTYGSPLPGEVEQRSRLCERCRQKTFGEQIKRGFTGETRGSVKNG